MRGKNDKVVVKVVAILAELKIRAGSLEEMERMALLLQRAEEDRMGALNLQVIQQHQRAFVRLRRE